MSQNGPSPTFGGQPTSYPGDLAGQSGQPQTTDVIKDQAANTKDAAVAAGQQVATTTKEQAQNVVAEAGHQASGLLQQAKSELSDQAAVQHGRLIGGLHSLGDNLGSMAEQGQSGPATDLARQAAQKTHEIASWLEQREPADLVDELRGYARQRPGAFLVIAAGAGLLAGRLTRGAKDAAGDSAPGGSTAGSTRTARMTAPRPAVPAEPMVDVTVVTPLTQPAPPVYAATRAAVESGSGTGTSGFSAGTSTGGSTSGGGGL